MYSNVDFIRFMITKLSFIWWGPLPILPGANILHKPNPHVLFHAVRFVHAHMHSFNMRMHCFIVHRFCHTINSHQETFFLGVCIRKCGPTLRRIWGPLEWTLQFTFLFVMAIIICLPWLVWLLVLLSDTIMGPAPLIPIDPCETLTWLLVLAFKRCIQEDIFYCLCFHVLRERKGKERREKRQQR